MQTTVKMSKKDFIFFFFAIKGHRFNGEKFIEEAINNGAVAIICSKKFKSKKKNFNNKNIYVDFILVRFPQNFLN